MMLVSFYAYWHWIVAGFLSPTQWMILDCYMMSHPMIPYGVVLCPPCYAHEPPDAGTRARPGLAVGVL